MQNTTNRILTVGGAEKESTAMNDDEEKKGTG